MPNPIPVANLSRDEELRALVAELRNMPTEEHWTYAGAMRFAADRISGILARHDAQGPQCDSVAKGDAK